MSEATSAVDCHPDAAAADTAAVVAVQEEYWPMMDAATATGSSLRTQHEIHAIEFGDGQRLRYKSISGHAMTPLDMNFSKENDDSVEDSIEDELYDGTGNLMWLAAISWAHLLAAKAGRLQPFLPRIQPKSNADDHEPFRICELGCGTGGGGIALALFHFMKDDGDDVEFDSNENSNSVRNTFHITFTDNDSESLELCKYNCELNGMEEEMHSQQLLWWGRNNLPQDDLQPASFDMVLATDVVYDLKMIRPLLETVSCLLKNETSYFVLSHVPRFCIPRETEIGDHDGAAVSQQESNDGGGSEAYTALEEHIVAETRTFGLILVDTLRPHEELKDALPLRQTNCQSYNRRIGTDSFHQVTIQEMEEAHAVVFVFMNSC